MRTDHILLQDETTERIAAILSDRSVEPIASIGVPACPIHAWFGNGYLAFPVRGGRRVQLWSVSEEHARRLETSVAPVQVRTLGWFDDRLLVGGRARAGGSSLWAGRVVDGAFEWQAVELSADLPRTELLVSALDTDGHSIVAAFGSDLLARLAIPGDRAQLWSTYRLPNTPDATIPAVRIGRGICAAWTRQRLTSCHPRASVETWNSVTVHRADSLELLVAVETPDDLVDVRIAEEALVLLTSQSVSSYAITELLEGGLDSAERDYLWGAPLVDARRSVLRPGFRPSKLRRSRVGLTFVCGRARDGDLRLYAMDRAR